MRLPKSSPGGVAWLARLGDGILVVGILYPLIVAFAFVKHQGRNVPFYDEWDRSARIAIRAVEGTLEPGDLIRQHNEHRLVFSGLVTAALAHLNHWNLLSEMVLSLGLSALMLLFVFSILKRQDPAALRLGCVPLAMMTFWPAQQFNWLVGFQTQIYFFMLFSVCATWVLVSRERGWRPMLIAAVLANCAQFSQGGGVAIWPALLVGLWMLDYSGRQLAAWLLIAAVSLAVFFAGYSVPSPPTGGLVDAARYALTYLGNPFFVGSGERRIMGSGIAAIVGLALFAWNLAALRADRRWDRAAPWVVLAVLALGTAALVARSRTHLGLETALSSRYVTQASMYWLGLCGLCGVVTCDRTRAASRTLGDWATIAANATFFALLIVLYFPTASTALSGPLVSDAQVACLRQYPSSHEFDCLAGIHPAFDRQFSDVAYQREILGLVSGLAAHRLGPFAESDHQR